MANFTKQELHDLVRTTAKETAHEVLTGLGVDVDHPIEVQQDFAALREWRTSMCAVRKKAVVTSVGVVVAGVVAAIWLGIKYLFTD